MDPYHRLDYLLCRLTRKLINHVSLFALAWGFLGFMIGMISALDAISVATGISSSVLAGGLKVGEIASRARISGASIEEAIQETIDYGIGQDFQGGFLNYKPKLKSL